MIAFNHLRLSGKRPFPMSAGLFALGQGRLGFVFGITETAERPCQIGSACRSGRVQSVPHMHRFQPKNASMIRNTGSQIIFGRGKGGATFVGAGPLISTLDVRISEAQIRGAACGRIRPRQSAGHAGEPVLGSRAEDGRSR